MSDETILFVSDLHFGRQIDDFERQRRDSFFRFLEAHAGVPRLVIYVSSGRYTKRLSKLVVVKRFNPTTQGARGVGQLCAHPIAVGDRSQQTRHRLPAQAAHVVDEIG